MKVLILCIRVCIFVYNLSINILQFLVELEIIKNARYWCKDNFIRILATVINGKF